MKKILILGASSFSGSSFANFMLDKNFYVIATYRQKKNSLYQPHLQNRNKKNLKNIQVDLNKNINYLLKMIKIHKPSVIVDFASLCMVNESWKNPDVYFKSNLEKKSILIKELTNKKFLKKYIYISTPEIFGSNSNSIKENYNIFNPSTPYAVSKLSFELLLKSYGKLFNLPFIICRFSNFYGISQPNYRLIPKVVLSILKRKKFPLQGSGLSKRNFIESFDFSNGIYKALMKGKIKSTYHFSTNKFYTIKDVIKKICKINNYKYEDLVKTNKERTGKDKIYILNCKKTIKELNWRPKINFEKSLRNIISYYQKNLKILSKLDTKYKDKNLI
ncbi:GDP-mannose 4,6-dehydratase [Candidatus Pelagibacter bacterium nBUS_44]|uniref:GDP-mannose 4,6-dehydratase n=1 Tax=Candidatus Pelagibacter bacterium nBUS_44 TaxID=3374195 RepID=UPI003EBFC044